MRVASLLSLPVFLYVPGRCAVEGGGRRHELLVVVVTDGGVASGFGRRRRCRRSVRLVAFGETGGVGVVLGAPTGSGEGAKSRGKSLMAKKRR